MSAPAVPAGHKVKHAVQTRNGKGALFTVECSCGWSSMLHQTSAAANAAYAAHRDGGDRAS